MAYPYTRGTIYIIWNIASRAGKALGWRLEVLTLMHAVSTVEEGSCYHRETIIPIIFMIALQPKVCKHDNSNYWDAFPQSWVWAHCLDARTKGDKSDFLRRLKRKMSLMRLCDIIIIIQIFISTLRLELADHIFCIPMSNCLIADTEVPENAHMAYRVKFLLNEMIMS